MLLIIGQIVRPHGIHGEVVVDVRTDEPERRFGVGVRFTRGVAGRDGEVRADPAASAPLVIEQMRAHQGRLLIFFEGVPDRNAADELRGVLLCVDSAQIAPPEDPDEFHDYQLVGLRAETPDGEKLGDVVRVEHAPASDLLVLRLPEGRTGLVPFVRAIVPEVDLPGGRVVVTPPEGLFDV